jgi:predicted deacylase
VTPIDDLVTSVKPGTSGWSLWRPLEENADSEVPIAVLVGENPGPTLWLQGALHGNEFDAAVATQAALREIRLGDLRGTVIGLPVVNGISHHAGTRVLPGDGKDPNRQFPGDPHGTDSERLAFALSSGLANHATYFVDVHSSTETFLGIDHTIYLVADDPTAKISRQMAQASGTAVMWESTGGWLQGSSYIWAANRGIPSILLDVGEIREFGQVAHAASGLLGVLRALDMLPRDSVAGQREFLTVRDPEWMRAQAPGLLTHSVGIGAEVEEGTTLFRVLDLNGQELQTASCPFNDGVVVTIRRPHQAHVDEDVVSIGRRVRSSPSDLPAISR